MLRWGMWLQVQVLTDEMCHGAKNGLANHASRIVAQLMDDFTARRYKKITSGLYYGQNRVPELDRTEREV